MVGGSTQSGGHDQPRLEAKRIARMPPSERLQRASAPEPLDSIVGDPVAQITAQKTAQHQLNVVDESPMPVYARRIPRKKKKKSGMDLLSLQMKKMEIQRSAKAAALKREMIVGVVLNFTSKNSRKRMRSRVMKNDMEGAPPAKNLNPTTSKPAVLNLNQLRRLFPNVPPNFIAEIVTKYSGEPPWEVLKRLKASSQGGVYIPPEDNEDQHNRDTNQAQECIPSEVSSLSNSREAPGRVKAPQITEQNAVEGFASCSEQTSSTVSAATTQSAPEGFKAVTIPEAVNSQREEMPKSTAGLVQAKGTRSFSNDDALLDADALKRIFNNLPLGFIAAKLMQHGNEPSAVIMDRLKAANDRVPYRKPAKGKRHTLGLKVAQSGGMGGQSAMSEVESIESTPGTTISDSKIDSHMAAASARFQAMSIADVEIDR